MRESVARMWIDEDGVIDVVSDHNMLVVECMVGRKSEVKVKEKKEEVEIEGCKLGKFSAMFE